MVPDQPKEDQRFGYPDGPIFTILAVVHGPGPAALPVPLGHFEHVPSLVAAVLEKRRHGGGEGDGEVEKEGGGEDLVVDPAVNSMLAGQVVVPIL